MKPRFHVEIEIGSRILLGDHVFLLAFEEMFVVLEGEGHFLFLALLRTLRELVVGLPLDDRTGFSEGFLVEVAGFFDPLDFSWVIGKAELVSGAGRLEKHVLFDNGRASLGLGLESFAAVLDILVNRFRLVVLGIHLAIDFFLLSQAWSTLGAGWWFAMDLRLLSRA